MTFGALVFQLCVALLRTKLPYLVLSFGMMLNCRINIVAQNILEMANARLNMRAF